VTLAILAAMSRGEANGVTRPGDANELLEVVACPACRTPLDLEREQSGACSHCGQPYRRLAYGWELLPPREETGSELWSVWDQLQANGMVSYEADPEHNLGVGPRKDVTAFARFCELRGRVLDVGCGPQRRPGYFDPHASDTTFVGIDPLVGESPADYPRVRGIAEHLPFLDGAFDRVLFATTLDHFVDPVAALVEAGRVLKPDGHIDVWLGHKRSDAPPPAISHAWYEALTRPDGAEDVFHVRRLGPAEAADLFESARLRAVDAEVHQIDEFRTNHFFRLVNAAQ
jgi:SAM-dependent methyltransferase